MVGFRIFYKDVIDKKEQESNRKQKSKINSATGKCSFLKITCCAKVIVAMMAQLATRYIPS